MGYSSSIISDYFLLRALQPVVQKEGNETSRRSLWPPGDASVTFRILVGATICVY